MKRILLVWLAWASIASAFTGYTIAPVVVYVVDETDKPVPNATVQIVKSRLDQFTKYELDPKSEFAALSRAAAQPVKTNTLGMALAYCGGGFVPFKDSGKMSGLTGEVVVGAEGFQESRYRFSRDVCSAPDGATELVLQITIKLRKAKSPGAAQPATKPADEAPVKDQPSTPMSKDGPR